MKYKKFIINQSSYQIDRLAFTKFFPINRFQQFLKI